MRRVFAISLIFAGSLSSVIFYAALLAFSFYGYYIFGIQSPVEWVSVFHWPSLTQLVIFFALLLLLSASIYLIIGAVTLLKGKQPAYLAMTICSVLTSPMGLLSIVGLALVRKTFYRSQP